MQAGERAAEHDAKVALVLDRKLNIGATDAAQAVGGVAGLRGLAGLRKGAVEHREAESGNLDEQIVFRGIVAVDGCDRDAARLGQLADGEVDGSRALDQADDLVYKVFFQVAVVVARRTRLGTYGTGRSTKGAHGMAFM